MDSLEAAAAASAYSPPDVSMTIRVAVYEDVGMVYVIGPAVQYPNGGFQTSMPNPGALLKSIWELSGRFIPAMPNGLSDMQGFDAWINSVKSQGLDARRVQ